MDISSASSLFDNPDVVSDLMPGIHAKFVEIESDFFVCNYRGNGFTNYQAEMMNDLNYIGFSFLLSGKVNHQMGSYEFAPAAGSGNVVFAPLEQFSLQASCDFQQIEVMTTLDKLQELTGDHYEMVDSKLRSGPIIERSYMGREPLESAVRLAQRIESPVTSPLLMKSAALEFLAWGLAGVNMTPDQDQVPARERKLLMIARDRLLSDLTKAPTIAELSREVGLNQLKLKQGFKKIFGTSIYAMFLQERMKKAHQLLQDHNVAETAYLVGYSNVSHFSKAFVQHYGMTPGVARKQCV